MRITEINTVIKTIEYAGEIYINLQELDNLLKADVRIEMEECLIINNIETIAKNGYNIEQNPVVEGTTRNPDYIIEGEIFDCYSPAENTKIRNVASTIEEKVIQKGQTERVVLNLDDWKGDIDALVKQLNDYPIEGLKEVIVVYDGNVQSIYP